MTDDWYGERRLLFVTGKGGVGKTTVAAAIALQAAQAGKRVLLTSCDISERVSEYLGVAPMSDEIKEALPRLHLVRLTPSVAMKEYGELVIGSRLLASAVFDRPMVRTFLAGVPGLQEWSMLGKAWYHAIEESRDGTPVYDLVVFDAPATGHGVDMLRMPRIILDVAPPGILRRDAQRAWDMLRDGRRTGVVVVTLPEELPVAETTELHATLHDDLGLPVHRLVINDLVEPVFAGIPLERLDEAMASADPRARAALGAGRRRAIREAAQDDAMTRLGRLGVPIVRLPSLPETASTREGLVALAAAFG